MIEKWRENGVTAKHCLPTSVGKRNNPVKKRQKKALIYPLSSSTRGRGKQAILSGDRSEEGTHVSKPRRLWVRLKAQRCRKASVLVSVGGLCERY